MPRAKCSQRGAVAVEAALVTPIFLLLVFGILEFGMLFKDWLAVSSSVRAGARLASAEPRVATFADDAADEVARSATALNMANVEDLWIYRAGPDGAPVGDDGTFSTCSDCVTYAWDGDSFVKQTETWFFTEQNACHGDPDRQIVGVHLRIRHDAVTGLILDDFSIAEHAVLALEPIPSLDGCRP